MSPASLSVCLTSYRGDPRTGGQGVYLANLARELTGRGHRVDVLSGPPYPNLPDGVRLVELPGLDLFGQVPWLPPLHRMGSLADWGEWLGTVTGGYPEPWAFGRRAAGYLETRIDEYDLIHDNQTLAPGLLSLMRPDRPLVASIHHPITVDRDIALDQAEGFLRRWRIRRWYRFTRMQKRVAPKVSRVITGSRHARNDIVREFNVSASRTRVIPYGVDTDRFRPREDVDAAPNRLISVTSTQWLRQIKGFGTLLEAFRTMLSRRPDLELVVVGTPDETGLTEFYSHDMGVASNLVFVNDIPTEQLITLYNRATAAVVASLYEGFGLPAAEAMACGTPVVATAAGGLPEVVGEAGVLVPPGDPDRLAGAVLDLLEDPGRRSELARRGRRRVKQRFQWEQTARRTEAVYRELLEESP